MESQATSNTSESANNMFAEAWADLGWLEAINKILLDIMSTRVCACRKKYAERDGAEVVPRVAQIVKRRWDAGTALMTVDELKVGYGDFKNKVVEPTSIVDERNGNDNVKRMARCFGDRSRVLCQAIFGMVQLRGLAGLLVVPVLTPCMCSSVQKVE